MDIGKSLIVIGIVLIATGVVFILFKNMGMGHLPGDIMIKKENFAFYFPITTCVVISVVLSLVLWIFYKK
ncbi:MAG: DUF2905 domain-containing protein [Candidatus Omnitrophica bacterium]|nr:DUF2905 domain-containing protein [Candidatus Omnitrophota bacterium]